MGLTHTHGEHLVSTDHKSGGEAAQATPPHHVPPASPAGPSLADEAEPGSCASADVEKDAEAHDTLGVHDAPEYTLDTADLDHAFALLREAVSRLRGRAARATAAGVKSEIQRLSGATFSENALGFTSFRSFLDAAQEAGVVSLALPAPGSRLDVTVSLDANPAVDTTVRRSARPARRRIRPDLWAAFVDWNQNFVRVWDRSTERAVIFPREPSVGEPASVQLLRKRYRDRPDGFVVIQPISQEQQLEWMSSFAQSVSTQAPGLQACLEEERPAAAFARTLRGDPVLGEAWRSQLSNRVYEVIETWATDSGLHVDPGEAPFGPNRSTTPKVSRPPRRLNAFEFAESDGAEVSSDEGRGDLRGQLLAVLSELSTDELLQIKVPIVYALRP